MKNCFCISSIVILVVFFFLFQCTFAYSDIGVGISGNRQTIVIEEFPFTYENTIWIQNTGDEQGIFSVAISGMYADVVDWIDISPTLVYLEPGKGATVRYTLHAREGYAGSYSLEIVAIGYSSGEKSYSLQPVAYMNAQTQLGLSIVVTQEAGEMSSGTHHPSESSTDTVTQDIDSVHSPYVVNAPIYMDVSTNVYAGHKEHLSAGYIDGSSAPASMKLVLYSPSGKTYNLELDTYFSFEEPGEWIVAVAIDDSILLGRGINVIQENKVHSGYLFFIFVCICIITILLYHVINTKNKHQA